MKQQTSLFVKRSAFRTFLLTSAIMFLHLQGRSQSELSLTDLSAFNNAGRSWQIAGNVFADLDQANMLKTNGGTGILVNVPKKNDHGTDLYTKQQYSDLDLELEYLLAKGSNSGIYLLGRYELQLLDSWATGKATTGDNGGIYERWDESRGKGNEGYDGHAPRQNVSRAPGLWQKLKVSFQAPRFGEDGKKTENARILRMELNGVLIHENVELAGPTRGAMDEKETSTGPLRLQGDHGAVAFRNISIKNYNKPRPVLSDLSYKVYAGKFETEPDLKSLTTTDQGQSASLSPGVIKADNDFMVHYNGNIEIKEPGEYQFNLITSGGTGILTINGQRVKNFGEFDTKKVTLPAGTLPFEMLYAKTASWERPSFALTVSSENIREYVISDMTTLNTESVNPILVDAGTTTTIMRSFTDIPGGKRVVHAVNVSSPQQLHYTYDLDRGMLLQAWRGGFLDATPMWHDRGDGSSRALGSKLNFGDPSFTILKLNAAGDTWKTDTAGTGFLNKGYEVNAENQPTFIYHIYGARIKDALSVGENGQSLTRTINVENNPGNLFIRIAAGKNIETISKGWYLVDDKSYYLRLDDKNLKPSIRTVNGVSELIAPVQQTMTYSLLF